MIIMESNVKNEIINDFETMKKYFGVTEEMKMPEMVLVSDSIDDANFILGACKFSTFPIAMNKLRCVSLNSISIFAARIKNAIDRYLKTSNTVVIAKFFAKFVRYIALHEMIHHFQMRKGMDVEVNTDDPKEKRDQMMQEIEKKCAETTYDFVNKYHKDDTVLRKLTEIDICELSAMCKEIEPEIAEKTKEALFESIENLLLNE